ncbi:SGNH/GDSL hydrolase family protein [Sediminicola sp. YIK13]|uniref:SGNH/GDSL hydrolase family protein n=1 Tax=Sediminicola sp. YIK13 TaxID=1453352 RepID=UPI0009EAB3D3|nr:SGNH/GDSL hydrolase family protein [Sediminicola sp. YIK13]
MTGTLAAQDWANLNKYKHANLALEKEVISEDRIVFMGNSITEGWIDHNPEFFKKKGYFNRGISGQTTPQMLLRFRQDVLDLKPKVVVLLAGINDIAGNTGPSTQKMIVDNIFSMVELAKAHGIKVVLSSVLPASDFPWAPGLEPSMKVIALNTALKQYAEINGHVYLDYFSNMVDSNNGLQERYTYDGIHPNAFGYQIMGPLAKAAIQKAMDL